MSAGGPLSAKIELPPEILEVLGELKGALSSVRKELRSLEKESRATLYATGQEDAGLVSRIENMRDAEKRLEGRLNAFQVRQAAVLEQNGKAQLAEDEADLNRRRVHFVTGAVSRAFGADSGVGGVAHLLSHASSGALNTVQRASNIASMFGAQTASKLLTGAATAGERALLAATPAMAIGGAIAGVGVHLARSVIDAQRAQGAALQAQAERQLSVVGGPIQSPLAVDDSRIGRLGFRALARAQAEGRALAPRGWSDILTEAMGATPVSAIQYGEELAAYEKKLFDARKVFGQSYSPIANRQVFNAADLAFQRRTSFFYSEKTYGDPVSAAWFHAKYAYYSVLGSGDQFIAQEYRKELQKASEKDMEDEKTRRNSEMWAWNNGVRGAVNRVLLHENRRHIAAVEQDRIARWASWGMQ